MEEDQIERLWQLPYLELAKELTHGEPDSRNTAIRLGVLQARAAATTERARRQTWLLVGAAYLAIIVNAGVSIWRG